MFGKFRVATVLLGCLSTANAFGFSLVSPSCTGISVISQASSCPVGRRFLTPPSMSMSTTGAARSASDVLAELDELDSVLGVETQDQEDLKPKQAYLNKLAVQAAQSRWREVDTDSGSSRVQVAILTEKIVYLTKHMQRNPQDFHSRRGLIAMVNSRRKQLNYYFSKEPDNCLEMCQALGIRFRPKTKVRSRDQRYAAFKNTKSKIGEARRTDLINKEREQQRQTVQDRRKASRAARGYT